MDMNVSTNMNMKVLGVAEDEQTTLAREKQCHEADVQISILVGNHWR